MLSKKQTHPEGESVCISSIEWQADRPGRLKEQLCQVQLCVQSVCLRGGNDGIQNCACFRRRTLSADLNRFPPSATGNTLILQPVCNKHTGCFRLFRCLCSTCQTAQQLSDIHDRQQTVLVEIGGFKRDCLNHLFFQRIILCNEPCKQYSICN